MFQDWDAIIMVKMGFNFQAAFLICDLMIEIWDSKLDWILGFKFTFVFSILQMYKWDSGIANVHL